MLNLKPGQTEEEAVIEYLLSMGFKEMGEEERKSDWYPAPNEEEEIRRWIAGEDDPEDIT